MRRSLLTLVPCGYLVIDEKRFRPTDKVGLLSAGSGAPSPAKQAQPILERVSHRLGESVSLAVLDHADIVYIARAQTHRMLTLDLAVGSRLPATCTSIGRILLAFLPEQLLAPILAQPRLQRTPRTVVEEKALRTILRQVRRDGHCIVDGELELGLRSLAVPVMGLDRSVSTALNVSTLAARTPLRDVQRIMLPAVQEAARAVAPLFAQREA